MSQLGLIHSASIAASSGQARNQKAAEARIARSSTIVHNETSDPRQRLGQPTLDGTQRANSPAIRERHTWRAAKPTRTSDLHRRKKRLPPSAEIEGTTVTLKESSSRTRELTVDGVYQNDQTQLLDDLSGRLFAELKEEGDVHMHVLGAHGTGKSRCLFGANGEEGLIERICGQVLRSKEHAGPRDH